MHFVHTFWTPPKYSGDIHISKIIECDTLYYALSFAYLKKLGQEVVLHTDDKGAEILSFIPYDKVYLTLNDIPENANHNMWACGKFFAMKNEPLDSIHIDGDVFIKSEECLNEIIKQYNDNDIVVQDIEVNVHYSDYSYLLNAGIKTPPYSTSKFNDSCCKGIIGFNNQKLKDEYLELYFNLFEQISENEKLKKLEKSVIIDLVCEQYFLKCLCDTSNYSIGVLINNFFRRYDYYKKYGYEHLMGIEKYKRPKTLSKCKFELLSLYRELFSMYVKNADKLRKSEA